MRSHSLQHLRPRIALAISITLLGATGALPGGLLDAGVAEATETVTIHEGSTEGSAVPAGTALVGTSGNFVIATAAGSVKCASSIIEGPLESNGKVENEWNAKSVTAKECTTTFIGNPTATVSTNAPWEIDIQWWSLFDDAWWRPFWPNHLTNLSYTVKLSNGSTCIYGFKEMKGVSPSFGPPLMANFSKQPVTKESGSSFICSEKGEFSAEYKVKTAKGTELAVTTP